MCGTATCIRSYQIEFVCGASYHMRVHGYAYKMPCESIIVHRKIPGVWTPVLSDHSGVGHTGIVPMPVL